MPTSRPTIWPTRLTSLFLLGCIATRCLAQTVVLGGNYAALLQDLQTQLSSARASGSAINLQIPAGNFNVNQSLLLDLTTALQPVGVTITGQGVGSTVLDCQGRNLTAILVKNASSTVLSDLTVQNCGNDIPGLGGGGVHLETTGDITVTRCVYRGNGASRNQAVVDGAGIRLSSPLSSTTAINNVQITDCSFIGNVGQAGGGISAKSVVGNLRITNCLFQSNNASTAAGVNLERINIGSIAMDRCQFITQRTSGDGGGVNYLASSAPLTITNTDFVNCTAGAGGGLGNNISPGTLTVINSTFTGSSAGWGGGYCDNDPSGNDPTGNVFFVNCTLTGNRANNFGGAVNSWRKAATISYQGCTFQDNTAAGGGAIQAFWGRGAFFLNITNTTFQGNSAGSGALVIDGTDNHTVVITGSRFINNTGRSTGGGFAIQGSNSTTTIRDTTFAANKASTTGAGLYVQESNVTLVLTGSTFRDNTAQSGGGMAAVRSGTQFSIVTTLFSGNIVDRQGGAMRFENQSGTVLIQRCVVDNNRALQGGAGFFAAPGSAIFTFQDTVMQNNVAIGALVCSAAQSQNTASSVVLLNTTFTNNGNQTLPNLSQCLPSTNGTALSPPLPVSSPPPPSVVSPSPVPVTLSPPVASPIPQPPPSTTSPIVVPPSTIIDTPQPSTPSVPTPQSDENSTNLGLIIGAAVGGAAGAALLAGLIAFLVVRRNRRRASAQAGDKALLSQLSGTPPDANRGAATWPDTSGPDTSGASTAGAKGISGAAARMQGPAGEVTVVMTSPPDTEQLLATRKSQASGTTGTSSGSTSTGPSFMGSRQLKVSASAYKSQSAGGSWTKAMSSYSGAAPSSADSYAVYQREMLARLQIPWASLKLGRVIGKGGFGVVYQGKWQASDVAVKTFDNVSSESRQDLQREALAMCELRHPYIAHIFGLVDDGPHCALVMKYYKGGTVSALIAKRDYIEVPMSYRLMLALQVATGMRALHERHIIHGDLKTSNLLIDRDGRNFTCIITDFGLSVFTGETQSSGALTIHISPPEVLRDPRAPRTQAGDVYAFGIVLLEIVTGRPAYPGRKREAIVAAVVEGKRPPIPAHVPSDIGSLIQSCWSEDPSARPSFSDLVRALEREESEAIGADGQSGHDTTATMTMTSTTIRWPSKADAHGDRSTRT